MTVTSTLDEAAAHVAAAAELLETQDASEELFSPARSLAAQLALIGNGISPGIASGPSTADSALDHVNHALTLMDSLDTCDAPPDHVLWALRLRELRPRVAALVPAQP